MFWSVVDLLSVRLKTPLVFGLREVVSRVLKGSCWTTPTVWFDLICAQFLASNIGWWSWLVSWLKLGRVSNFFFPLRRWNLSSWKPYWYSGFVRSCPGCRRDAGGHCNETVCSGRLWINWFQLTWVGLKLSCVLSLNSLFVAYPLWRKLERKKVLNIGKKQFFRFETLLSLCSMFNLSIKNLFFMIYLF